MMNIFRISGDMSHLISFLVLIFRLWEKRNADGISLKTQELYLLVFVTRYLDLFTNFYSLYNTMMKLFYIAASGAIVYVIRKKEPWRSTYLTNTMPQDTFLHIKFAVLPCLAVAMIINDGSFSAGILSYLAEVAWAFSIYLEAIAIVPQLIMLQRYKSVENITSWYMVSLGAYRALYICNWVYRYWHEPHYSAWIPWIAGVVQTAFFADFFYYFALAKYKGKSSVILPS